VCVSDSKSVVSSWGLYIGLSWILYELIGVCMSKYSIPLHIPVTHRLSSILHSPQLCCSTLHRDADEQGALGPPTPPSQGCLSYSAPDKTLPTCPRAWEWGSTGVHIISPTCARPHQLRMSFYANPSPFLPPSHYVPIISFEELE